MNDVTATSSPSARNLRLLSIVFLSLSVFSGSQAAAWAADEALQLPVQKFESMPGKVVGVLANNSQAVLANEGRKGPADAVTFGSGKGSQRWVYLPDQKKPLIGAMVFPVGEDGKQKKRYNRLNLATLTALKPAGITEPFTLVEVEVNGGLGCPDSQAFVATAVQSVEGSKRYPLHVSEVVVRLQQQLKEWKKTNAQVLEAALTAQRKQLGWQAGKGTTSSEDQLLYVTWIQDRKVLAVQIRTRLQEKDPLPTPPKPPIASSGDDGPPPKLLPSRIVGVEAGMGYEVSRVGKIERMEPIPLKAFHRTEVKPDNSRIAVSR